MRTLLVSTMFAALVATAPLAFAADMASGAIKAFDSKANTVTLADGTTYSLPKNFKDPGLKVGEKVQIAWAMQNGKHAATQVKIVK